MLYFNITIKYIMSQYNLRYVPVLSADQFILNGQRFNTQAAAISANGNIINTPALSTEVIINDATKNQALFAGLVELQGEVSGNVNPNLVVVDSRLTALEGNVAILQGNVIFLQNEINDINSNISGLNANTQYLHAPYNGLAGNTSYFTNGLQVWNGADENGNGIFSYVDGGAPADQISLKVQNGKNILLNGGSTNISPQSVGNVSVNNADGNFNFLVGNRTLPNFQNISKTEINGRIDLKGETNTAISIYTQPAEVVPLPIPAIKRCDVRGDDETRLFGKLITATDDDGGKISLSKSVSIFTPGGSAPGQIDLQVGSCDLNTTGKINIGTTQGLTEAGFKEIYIGQSGPPSAARKSSTLIDGDLYLPQNLILQQNLGGWDNIVYLGLPTAYSGALRGPVKNTYSPYVKSISTFSAAPTINSFIQSSGTFSVAVGLGAITLNAGAGGILTNCAGGLISMTSLIGGIGLTTAGGAIALTTGAGIIQMTTGAAPIAMETNYGDILLKAGYSNQSTPELSIGSVYLQARNYTYITPDEGVIVGEGIVTPFNDTLLNTMNYPFSGNLFSNAFISNLTGVFSNTFITPNSTTTLLNPITSNLIYSNLQYETGSAYALLRNMDINGTIATSSLATVPSGNLGANVAITNTTTNFFFPDNTVFPLNANVKVFVYIPDTPNISHYQYSTWQSNANIASNISGLVNGYVEPLPPVYDNYMTVLGNVGILSDLDVGANITVASSSFPLQQTVIKRNSIITTGDITCSTLNYSFLNPPISGNVAGVSQIIAGNGIEISPLIGTGNVTVSLAGSVIPPGGYLPIAGGTMTGPIYQYPQGNLNYNTVKKYRPLSSYQPPFPSISPPTFTGELLTFYNGDNNSPTQTNFTGWFPQSLVSAEPDFMTQLITGAGSNIYSLANTNTPSPYDITSCLSAVSLTNGVHITGGTVYISQIETTKPLTLTFGYLDSTPFYTKTFAAGSFPSSGLFTFTLDYTHTLSTGQYTAYWDNSNQNFSLMVANPIIKTNWCGTLTAGTSSYYLMVFNSGLTSQIFKWFPGQNTTEKVFTLDGSVYGIQEQLIGSRILYFYGLFDNITVPGPVSARVNNIFTYNVDTGIVQTLSADTALQQNPPLGTNGAVYGVEVDTTNDRTWFWGDFDYVGTDYLGNPTPQRNDIALICGCDFTTTADWQLPVIFEGINGYRNCRGGKLLDWSSASYSLMVWAAEQSDGNNPPSFLPFNNIGMNYYQSGTFVWTTANGNCMSGGSITQPVANIQLINNAGGSSNTRLFFTGSFNNGVAYPSSNTCLSIMYSVGGNSVDSAVGQYTSELYEAYNSSDTAFWVDNGIQISVSNVRKMSNDVFVMNTNGYGLTNGGGVLALQSVDQTGALPTKYNITGMPRYNTKFIGGNDATKILLTCSLNENNFFYSQTFDSTPSPTPTDPTVIAINGAKFLVDNTAMDKIVFAGSDQDYSSVSFIAGKVEDNDYNWYWQAQVGQLNYYAGATLYPNISACPTQPVVPGPTTSTWGTVLLNGNVASKGIDMSGFDILNGNTIFSANILTLSAPNAVEVGVGTRRIQPVLTVILDTLGNNGESNFSTNYVISAHFSVSSPTYFSKNSLIGYFRFDDGMGGGFGYLTPSIYQQSTGNLMATGTSTYIAFGSGQNYTFSFPNDVLLPATDTYYFTFTTDGQSPSYFFYGWQTADPTTVCSFAEAVVYAPVSDPLDFFNVYGNTFLSDRITTYGDILFENPSISLVANVLIDKTQMLLTNFENKVQITPSLVKVFNTNPSVNTIYSQLEYNVFTLANANAGGYGTFTYDAVSLIQQPVGFSNTNTMQIDGYRVQYYQTSNYSNQAQLLSTSGSSTLFLSASQLSGTPVGYSMTLEAPLSGSFKLACSTLAGPGAQKPLDITNTGTINIQTTNASTITLVNSTSQLTLNASISTLMGTTATMKTPSDNNNFIVSTASQFHNSADVDDISNPTLQIVNNNASTASYPVLKFNKSTTNTLAGNVISAVSSWARDYTGTSIEWSRIQTKVENNGVGNQDSTLSIYNIVNGTLSEVFNFNGGQNEINSFRPLDMNGNDVRSTIGNVIINATLSTGTGQVQIQTKPGTLGSGAGLAITGNTMTATSAGGSSGHHMCITLPDPTTGLPRVYKIALLNP